MDSIDRNQVRSFLIGSILGDCYASPVACQWVWSNTDLDWIEWKAAFVRQALGHPCSISSTDDPSCRSGKMHRFSAAQRNGRLRVYREWFYDVHGIKRITKQVQHLNHPLGLAVLLLDQGSCRGGVAFDYKTQNEYIRKPSIRFHLNAHPERELMLFQSALKTNFGLRSSLQRKARGHIDVYLGTQATQDFWAQVRPWVPNIPIARRKLAPLFFQGANADRVRRKRGVDLAAAEAVAS